MDLFLLVAALVVFGSILLTPVSARIGAPLLLLFLAVGMLAGEDGPGGLHFDDFELAYEIGTMALALILLAGGLDTPLRDLRKAAAPAIVMATLGVVLTAGTVGIVTHLLLGLSIVEALLLGSVVASTDAAATFLLLRQSGVVLKGRMRETILVESGLNDPMAIFLTVAFVGLVDAGMPLSWETLPGLLVILAQQLGLGALGGIAGGIAAAAVARRIVLPAGLYAPLMLAAAFGVFAATRLVEGSGFLAIYLFGIVVTARAPQAAARAAQFMDGISWLAQIVMFLMLGLLVTPHELRASALPALFIAAVLIFLARPLATLICLTPLKVPLRQQAYIGWVGLRGAVPIFLAIIPVISPGPVTAAFFDIVFVIVIASLVLQGWTIVPMARWLGVTGKDEEET
ncbi:MAG: potassium/proton antiporter [Proteobacteria bacterium]|nr:potassium/proton antiporter [Pseudomonadota bacterium]